MLTKYNILEYKVKYIQFYDGRHGSRKKPVVMRLNQRRVTERYLRALLQADEIKSARVIDQTLKDSWSPMKIYLDLLSPVMVEIGELWSQGKINVAQEHQATEMTLVQMERLRRRQGVERRLDLSVAVACVEGEQHFLGALMAADAFRFEGWRVEFLGSNVPSRDLVEWLSQRPVHLLALSVTLKAHLASLQQIIADLGRLPARPAVLAGGAALKGEDFSAEWLGFEIAKDPVEGLQMARRLLKSGARSSLAVFLQELGKRIRECRVERNWSQQELAESASLDRTYVVAIEQGKQNLTLGVLLRLAEALGTSAERLLPLSQDFSGILGREKST
jgi:methanogenic corrinoid protein MtbC1/DNA-binding XRE family transcriptional regulator